MDIIKKVKSLDLPEGEYLVFGSGPMGIREIRGVGDIDLLISFNLYQRLEKRGWREKTRESSGGKYLVYESVEATQDWICGDYYPSLERLLKTMDVFDGVPFASLEEVISIRRF